MSSHRAETDPEASLFDLFAELRAVPSPSLPRLVRSVDMRLERIREVQRLVAAPWHDLVWTVVVEAANLLAVLIGIEPDRGDSEGGLHP